MKTLCVHNGILFGHSNHAIPPQAATQWNRRMLYYVKSVQYEVRSHVLQIDQEAVELSASNPEALGL